MEDNGYSGLQAVVMLIHPHPTRVLLLVALVTFGNTMAAIEYVTFGYTRDVWLVCYLW